ncbi:DUF6542 domain-containing protein [Streptomyces sp. NPDC006367]|uniref:DUF6542 domain-containing protein n=1 Tax=Streptomyces sp. NPDC006367 TaxID=3156759 RepID=UPI0033ABCADC
MRDIPNPRLTGLGSGLFCTAVMTVLGFLDALLFGGSLTVYGVLFLPVCVLTACWVHRGDLLTAPVVVPIAFAAGLVTVTDGGTGLGDRLMGLVTALATEAGWLYGGTLIAGAIVITRRVRLVRRRTAPSAPSARTAPSARIPRAGRSAQSVQSARSPQSPQAGRGPRAARNPQAARGRPTT